MRLIRLAATWAMAVSTTLALAVEPTPPVSPVAVQAAVKTVEGMMKAFGAGNLDAVEKTIAPDMIGRQELIDAMRQSHGRHRQIQITLQESQTTRAVDVVVVQSRWEKRVLVLPKLTPAVRQGRTVFLMKKSGAVWQLTGQSGDNVFAP